MRAGRLAWTQDIQSPALEDEPIVCPPQRWHRCSFLCSNDEIKPFLQHSLKSLGGISTAWSCRDRDFWNSNTVSMLKAKQPQPGLC